jgi:rhodanese-related sulfurtransferase
MEKSLDDFVNEALEHIEEISVDAAAQLLAHEDRDGWTFVDVREGDEFSAGHVPTARHSPRGFLEVRADRVHPKRDPWFDDRDRKLILYCGGGNRSALAARVLGEMGFTQVRSMAGGFAAWTAGNLPVES